MKSLLLAIGFRTEHRAGEPTVLASGFDRAALQGAVNAAPAEFRRFELGIFQFTRKALRTGPAPEAIGEGPGGAPTMEEGLALLERIEQLEKVNESYGRQLAEFEDVKVRYVDEIERLTEELKAAQALLSETAKPVSSELPTTTQVTSPSPEAAALPSSSAPAVAETSAAEPAPSETAAESSDGGGDEEGGPQLPPIDPAPGAPPRGRGRGR